MFLHIGGNITILEKDIVAIIDKESVENSNITKELIDNMIENNLLYGENTDNIKTYIITCVKKSHNKGIRQYGLYTSSISSSTLFKRNKDMENRLEVK